MTIRDMAAMFLRDFKVDGVASTGPNEPNKVEGRALFDAIATQIDAATAAVAEIPGSTADLPDATDARYVTDSQRALLEGGAANVGFVYATKAGLDANTTAATGTRAEVVSDPTAALNGVYQKGAGGWTKVQDLPYEALTDRVDTLDAVSPVTREGPDDGDSATMWAFLNKTFGTVATINADGRLRWLAGIDGARPDPDQGPMPYVSGGDLGVSGAATAIIGPGGGMAWLSAGVDRAAIVATRQRTSFAPVSKYRITRSAPFLGMLDDDEARSLWISDGQSHDPGSHSGLLTSTLAQKRGVKAIEAAYAFQGVVYPEHIEMLKCWQAAAGFRNDIRQGYDGSGGAVPRSTFSAWVALNPATIVGIEPARSVTTQPGYQYGVTPIESVAFHAVDMAMKKFGVAPRLAIASTGIGGASIANLSTTTVDKQTVLQGFKDRYAALGKRVRPSLHFWRHGQNEGITPATYKADLEAYQAQINAIYATVFPNHPAPKWLGPTHMYARQAGYEAELAMLELDREGKFIITTPLYGIAWLGAHEWGEPYLDTVWATDWVHMRPWGALALGALEAETALSLEAGVMPIKAPRFVIESRVGNVLNLLYSDLDDVEINTTLIDDPGNAGFVVSGGQTINSVVRVSAKRIAVTCATTPTGFLEYAMQAQTTTYSKNGIPRGCVMDTRRVVARDDSVLPRCATHQREAIP